MLVNTCVNCGLSQPGGGVRCDRCQCEFLSELAARIDDKIAAIDDAQRVSHETMQSQFVI